MERKTWAKPMTLVQKFEANETVAANSCFLIACKSDATYSHGGIGDTCAPQPAAWTHPEGYFDSAAIEGDKHLWFSHSNCRDASRNIFRISGNEITYLYEAGGIADRGGVDGWKDMNDDGKLGAGDVVYWYGINDETWTTGTRWNHWGNLEAIDPNRKNMS